MNSENVTCHLFFWVIVNWNWYISNRKFVFFYIEFVFFSKTIGATTIPYKTCQFQQLFLAAFLPRWKELCVWMGFRKTIIFSKTLLQTDRYYIFFECESCLRKECLRFHLFSGFVFLYYHHLYLGKRTFKKYIILLPLYY